MNFRKNVEDLSRQGLLRQTWPVESTHGAIVLMGGRPCINFASNNYLGLADREEVREAAARAIRDFGWGAGASRLMSGTHLLHEELEGRIASFKGTESALLFNSGYAANVGVLPALCGEDTLILSDELNHASLIDGIRLSKAPVRIYPHRDAEAARSLMALPEGERPVIVTDGVFSMDGDLAPVRILAGLAEQREGLLYVDDAHGTGVLGAGGRGTAEMLGVQSDLLVQMGTLSKALGSVGGFVAGSRDVIRYLKSRARPFIFSTALPPAASAAGLAALGLMATEGEALRGRLQGLCRYLARGLGKLGLKADDETPIFPVRVGSVEECLRVSRELRKHGIFSPAIRPPTVAPDACRIRISVMASHEESQLDRLLDVLGETL